MYIKTSGKFGTIVKTRFLGKYGLVISCDDEEQLALDEKKANADVYSKESGESGNGESLELLMDVRVFGVEILTSLNIPEAEMSLLFLKYIIGLDKETQVLRLNEFNEAKDDETKKQEFLTGLLAELEDDNSFVIKEGSAALFFVDSEIREDMFQRLLMDYPQEQR